MTKRNIYIFLLLISIFWLISFSGFKGAFRQDGQQKNTGVNDSTKLDTFQILANNYCKAKILIQATKSEILTLKNEIEQFKKKNIKDSLKRKEYEINRENLSGKTIKDSVVRSNDTLRQQFYSKRKVELAHYDRLIHQVDSIILSNLKEIKEVEEKLDCKVCELSKATQNFESSLKQVSGYALTLRGSASIILQEVTYYIFIADLAEDEIRVHLFQKKKQNFFNLMAVCEHLERKNIDPLMITNAGMFNPSREPVGLYIENGKTLYNLDTSKGNPEENFYLSPNGVFFIDTNNVANIMTTTEFAKKRKQEKPRIKLATQSGPMLVINNTVHPKFTEGSLNKKIRSGVGKISDKKVVFAVTTDESNFFDFALFFKEIFECKDALFLDGAISKMFLKDIHSSSNGGNFGPMISVSKKAIK